MPTEPMMTTEAPPTMAGEPDMPTAAPPTAATETSSASRAGIVVVAAVIGLAMLA